MAFALTDDRPRSNGGFAAAFGLATFALSLPVVRLLVDAPEFLIAHQLTPRSAAVYLLLVIVGLPLLLGLALTLLGRVLPVARTVAMAGLGVVAFGGLLQPISGWSPIFLLGALVGGTVLAVAEAADPRVRSVLATLGLASLLLVAWSVGPSRVGSYLRSTGDAPSASGGRALATPVVLLVFDEVSMIPMLRSDLTIDTERFPNVAALASTSHWYRRASSVSPQTSASVPALLSGVAPDLSKVPIASDYPTSAFAQLGASLDAAAYEPVTALCPSATCDRSGSPRSTSLRGLLDDTALILRQAVSSDSMRRSLPSIERGWAGFGADGAVDIDAEAAPSGGYGTFPAQVDELTSLLSTSTDDGRAPLLVGHLIAPHMPWISLPDGSTYEGTEPAGMAPQGGTLVWDDAEAGRRLGYQRYLLQVGALDRAIGLARDALERAGTWDDAIVVVTADHGVQFEPGGVRSVGAGGAEVTNVPLFIKEPHQHRGVVETAPALTIDALPTVLGLLGVEPRGHLDGVDLLQGEVPATRTDAFLVAAGDAITPDQRLDAIRAAVERRARWVDPDGGWDGAYQVGVETPLVGSDLHDRPTSRGGGTWARTAGESGHQVTFDARPTVEAEAIVASCGDAIAGAAPVAPGDAEGVLFTSPDRCSTPDELVVWALDAAGELHELEASS